KAWSSGRSTASVHPRRSGSPSARTTRTRSSRPHWATSFRAYRPEPVTLLPCGGVVGRPSARQLAPLGLAGFRLLFLSTLGSSIGTFLAAIALAIDVKDRTNSGLWVGAVLIVEFLPTIFVGLTLGPLLDRLERRSLMVGADLVRAAVFCALRSEDHTSELQSRSDLVCR